MSNGQTRGVWQLDGFLFGHTRRQNYISYVYIYIRIYIYTSLANELGFPSMIKGLRKEVDFIDVGPTTVMLQFKRIEINFPLPQGRERHGPQKAAATHKCHCQVMGVNHFSTCLFEVAQQSLANELGFPAMIKGLRKEVDFIDVGPTTVMLQFKRIEINFPILAYCTARSKTRQRTAGAASAKGKIFAFAQLSNS